MRMLLEHPPELLLLPPSPQAGPARPPSSHPLSARSFPRAACGAAPHKGPTCPHGDRLAGSGARPGCQLWLCLRHRGQ
jgi:hypothetical protein